MTPMIRHLRNEIAMHGPLTVAAYMAAAMGHPEHGYYINSDRPEGVDEAEWEEGARRWDRVIDRDPARRDRVAHALIEYLGGRAGQRAHTGVLEPSQVLLDGAPRAN